MADKIQAEDNSKAPSEDRSKLPKNVQDEFSRRDKIVPAGAKAVAPPGPPPPPSAEMKAAKEKFEREGK